MDKLLFLIFLVAIATFADGAAVSAEFSDPGAVVERRTVDGLTERQAIAT